MSDQEQPKQDLFTPQTLTLLQRREAEMECGKLFEVASIDELRQKVSQLREDISRQVDE
jgi:uncharacterized small protein (DUF1192 family)